MIHRTPTLATELPHAWGRKSLERPRQHFGEPREEEKPFLPSGSAHGSGAHFNSSSSFIGFIGSMHPAKPA